MIQNNINQEKTVSGIRVSNDIDFTVPGRKLLFNRVVSVIVAFIGIIGTIFSFFTQFDISVSKSAVLFYCLLFFGLFSVIFSLPRQFQLSALPIMGIYGLLLWRRWEEFSQGFKLVFDDVYKSIYEHSSGFFKVKNPDAENAELFAAFVIFLICAVICCSVITQPRLLFSFAFSFPFVEIGLYFGKTPSIFFGFLLMIFWISTGALKCCGYYQDFKNSKPGFIRKQNTFTARPGVKFHTSGACVIAASAAACLVFLLTWLFTWVTDYQRSERLNNMRSDLKLAVQEFSLDDFGESLKRISASLGFNDTKIYNHKLGSVGSVRFNHLTDLEITAKGVPEDNIYLKGYTAEVYSGDEWKRFDKSVYNGWDDMFSAFKAEKTFPQDMLTNYVMKNYNPPLVKMDIKAVHSGEQYNYFPYISVPEGKITYTEDDGMSLEDKQNYSVSYSPRQITDKNIDSFSEINYETNSGLYEYDQFVRENYLTVPDTDAMDRIYNRFIKDSFMEIMETDSEGRNVNARVICKKLENIKKILHKNAEYTLSPGATPDSEDYVEYFLTESHQGFCVHFATAGVILARMSGIPARYADGYVMLKSDFSDENKNTDGSYSIDIEDSRGHAWTEIYIEGLGWIPYDFTPASAEALGGGSTDEPSQTTTAVTEKETTAKTTASAVSTTKGKGVKFTSTTVSSPAANTKLTTAAKGQITEQGMSLRLKVLLIFIGGILAAVAAVFARYQLILYRRKKIFEGGSGTEKIELSYRLTKELLRTLGIEQGDSQFLEFAQSADRELREKGIDLCFTEVTEILLKTRFSGEASNEQETEKLKSCYESLKQQLFRRNNPLKKLIMRFVKVL